jgi:hypothetical protein
MNIHYKVDVVQGERGMRLRLDVRYSSIGLFTIMYSTTHSFGDPPTVEEDCCGSVLLMFIRCSKSTYCSIESIVL